MDLIRACPRRFLATDHVAGEISEHYPEQQARYDAAIASGCLGTCSVTDEAEIDLFRRLRPGQRLGPGECSAIAVAINRKYGLAIDNNRAVKLALRDAGLGGYSLEIICTQDVMVAPI